MRFLSECRSGKLCALRWRYRLFWCHDCGVRMPPSREGMLSLVGRGWLRWLCLFCFEREYLRAVT